MLVAIRSGGIMREVWDEKEFILKLNQHRTV